MKEALEAGLLFVAFAGLLGWYHVLRLARRVRELSAAMSRIGDKLEPFLESMLTLSGSIDRRIGDLEREVRELRNG